MPLTAHVVSTAKLVLSLQAKPSWTQPRTSYRVYACLCPQAVEVPFSGQKQAISMLGPLLGHKGSSTGSLMVCFFSDSAFSSSPTVVLQINSYFQSTPCAAQPQILPGHAWKSYPRRQCHFRFAVSHDFQSFRIPSWNASPQLYENSEMLQTLRHNNAADCKLSPCILDADLSRSVTLFDVDCFFESGLDCNFLLQKVSNKRFHCSTWSCSRPNGNLPASLDRGSA